MSTKDDYWIAYRSGIESTNPVWNGVNGVDPIQEQAYQEFEAWYARTFEQ